MNQFNEKNQVFDENFEKNSGGEVSPDTGEASPPVPRQNGKTCITAGRIVSGMILYSEWVIYTAHLQKTATETFTEIKALFETPGLKKYVKEIKNAIGREQVFLKNGARVIFVARTRNGGRGLHGDTLIFDEAQELTSDQQASFIPAISASKNPQTICLGTPPDENCTGDVFRRIRTKTLNGENKTTAWTEYSVAEIGNIADRNRWAAANPALGLRIRESTIEGELQQMDPDTFARERLGWWSEVSLCGAVCPTDQAARVSLIDRRSTSEGVQWLADWLNKRYNVASCCVIDGKNGVDFLIDKIKDTWKFKNSIMRPSGKDVIAAASQLVNEVTEQTVTWYKYQEQLEESAVTSVKRPISGGWGFGGENSTPIEAAALALWGCRISKRDPKRKMRIG